MIKSLWASVMGNPVVMRRANGWLTILWIVMIPISLATGWVRSVVFVSALSLWALVSGHLSAWQAARVEVNQDEDANVQQVLDKLNAMSERMGSFEEITAKLRRLEGES